MDILILSQELAETQTIMELAVRTFGIQGMYSILSRLFVHVSCFYIVKLLLNFYIHFFRFGWVVGVGRYIGQTKGVMYTQNKSFCPTNIGIWRYLNQDLQWKDNGDISVTCAS